MKLVLLAKKKRKKEHEWELERRFPGGVLEYRSVAECYLEYAFNVAADVGEAFEFAVRGLADYESHSVRMKGVYEL